MLRQGVFPGLRSLSVSAARAGSLLGGRGPPVPKPSSHPNGEFACASTGAPPAVAAAPASRALREIPPRLRAAGASESSLSCCIRSCCRSPVSHYVETRRVGFYCSMDTNTDLFGKTKTCYQQQRSTLDSVAARAQPSSIASSENARAAITPSRQRTVVPLDDTEFPAAAQEAPQLPPRDGALP